MQAEARCARHQAAAEQRARAAHTALHDAQLAAAAQRQESDGAAVR